MTDLAPVDVEGGDNLDVRGPVISDLPVHKSYGILRFLGLIERNPLDKGRGTVAYSYDCDFDFVHVPRDSYMQFVSKSLANFQPQRLKEKHIIFQED